ncbi:MAG: 50S ribosomal protein L29 [Flavobacteriales bacterium]|nr:50S ribosomal protein L29 [Flavobacteriales bacterium]
MPSKKFIELQSYSDADLINELKETETNYQKLKFDHSVRGLDNPLTLREVRRDIARINTEIRRRELSNLTEAQVANRSKIRSRRSK